MDGGEGGGEGLGRGSIGEIVKNLDFQEKKKKNQAIQNSIFNIQYRYLVQIVHFKICNQLTYPVFSFYSTF